MTRLAEIEEVNQLFPFPFPFPFFFCTFMSPLFCYVNSGDSIIHVEEQWTSSSPSPSPSPSPSSSPSSALPCLHYSAT